MAAPVSEPTSPLHIAEYRRFWLVRFTSEVAEAGMVVILGYQLYDIARQDYHLSVTQAAFQLGLMGLAQFLPLFLLTPVAGLVADRYDRRLVAIAALTVDLAVALALGFATARHDLALPLLFALAAGHGVARAFGNPAITTIAPNILPAALLPRGVALNTMAMLAGNISGPALAGMLYALARPAPYWVSSGLLVLAMAGLLMLRPIPAAAGSRARHPLRQIAEGFAFVRRSRFLVGCITLDLFAVLLGGATAMLPVYARDILHVGPRGLGEMRAAPAVGAACVALILALRPLSRNVGVKMLVGVVIYGAATVTFGLSTSFALSLGALVVIGASDMVSVFIRNALVQLYTPNDKRGRVSAISGVAISASNELGEMESGFVASLIGPVGAVVLGGVAAIVVTALWTVWFPQIRRARQFAAQYTTTESSA